MNNIHVFRFVIQSTYRFISCIYCVVPLYISLHSAHLHALTLPYENSIPFHHISVEQGLSQVTVNDITQDAQGFLWFATEDGLNRYDGKYFIHYQTDSDGEFKISGNVVNFIFNDSTNRLWAGFNGQGVSVKENNRFNPVSIFKQDTLLTNVIATVLYEDSQHQLWLGTWADGLFKYSEEKNQFINVYSKPEYNRIWSLIEFDHKLLIASDKNGIAELIDNNPEPWGNSEEINNISIKSLFVGNHKLWIGSEGNGLWSVKNRPDGSYSELKRISATASSSIQNIFLDKQNVLWIATTGNGIFKKAANKRWMHQTAGNDRENLSNNRILSIFQDKSGVLWFGTEGAGLNSFDPYSLLFRNIHQGNDPGKNLNDKMIYAISVDSKKNWWIGSESGGVNVWNHSKNQFQYFTVTSGHLNNNNVRAILKTVQGMLIGTLQGFSLISENGILISKWDKGSLPDLTNDIILSFAHATKNKVWIGTYNGLFLFDLKNRKIIKSFLDKQHNGPFSTKRAIILSILQQNKRLLVGTLSDGLYQFDLESNWKKISSQINQQHENAIYTIFEDDKHNIWLGTKGGGLVQVNKNTNKFHTFTKKQGLANNVVYGIMQDKQSQLWLSTNRGISKFDQQTEHFTNFSVLDGLQGREFNVGAFYHLNNIMAFGGINGISWFNLDEYQTNPFLPETQITSIKIFNQEISNLNSGDAHLTKKNSIPKTLFLNYNQMMFSIDFAALHYSLPAKNQYRYRMSGLDDNWIQANFNNSEATFTGLPAGDYLFQVKAISSAGLIDPSPATLKVIIFPPPWRTWWAYILYFAIMLLSIRQYILYLQRKLLYQKKINSGLKEIDKLKERLAETERMAILGELSSNVAHSLRNPLASIRSSAELIEDNEDLSGTIIEDAKNIISEVDRLSQWIKDLLAYSKNQKSQVELIDLKLSCRTILNDYDSIFIKNNIHLNFIDNISNALIAFDPLLFQHMLNSLLDNAIEAVKTNGAITLKLRYLKDDKIEMSLSDNGEGIPFDQQTQIFNSSYTTKVKGLGMGLSLVKRIVERHNAIITVTSKADEGTTFKILFTPATEK